MSWKVSTPMSERLALCRMAQEGHSMSALARQFGVSRKTAYKWFQRYQEEGEAGVFDRSRRPSRTPSLTEEAVVSALLSLQEQYPCWGPNKLHRLLKDRMGDATPSARTLARILRREGRTETAPLPPVHEVVGRFERSAPNDLWQTDFCSPFRLPDGQKLWTLSFLDDHSRYCLSLQAAPAPTTQAALEGFWQAARRYGLPRQTLSDHGSSYGVRRGALSPFTVSLWASEVEHIQGRVAHPQTQGKLERFNRTLQKECLRRHDLPGVTEWNAVLEEYRCLYNTVRPHEALGQEPPASRYRPSERPYIEPDRDAGEAGEGLLHRRVDKSGKVWLLGHNFHVGYGLVGWKVSARPDGNGYWTLLFRGRSLCQVHLARTVSYLSKP